MQANQMNAGGAGTPSNAMQLQQLQQMSQLQQQMLRQQQQSGSQQFPMNSNVSGNGMHAHQQTAANGPATGNSNAAQLQHMSQLQQEMLRQQQQTGNQQHPQGSLGNLPQGASQSPGQSGNQQWGLMFWACGDQTPGQPQGGAGGQMQQQNNNQGAVLNNPGGGANPNLSGQAQKQQSLQQQQQQSCINNGNGNNQQQGQSPLMWNASGPQQGAIANQVLSSNNSMPGANNGCLTNNQGQPQIANFKMNDQQQSQQISNNAGSCDINQLLLQQQAMIQQLQQQLQPTAGGNSDSSSALQVQQQTGMQQLSMQQRGPAMQGMQQQMPMGQQHSNGGPMGGLPGMSGMQQQQGSMMKKDQMNNMQGLLNMQGGQQQMNGLIQGAMGASSASFLSGNGIAGGVPTGNSMNSFVGNMNNGKTNLPGMCSTTGFGNSDSAEQNLTQKQGPNIQGKQQSFLDGSFAGGWQSNADLPDRRRIIFSIVKAIERMRPDASKMSQKVSLMAKKLEERLYRYALTKEEYLDQDTLKKRLQKVLQELQQQQQQQELSGNKEQQNNSVPSVPAPSPAGNKNGNPMMELLLKQQKQKEQLKEQQSQLLKAKASGMPVVSSSMPGVGAAQQVISQPMESSSVYEQLQNNWRRASKTQFSDMGSIMSGNQQDFDSISVGSHAFKGAGEGPDALAKAQKRKVIRQQQQRLVLLRHASKCTNGVMCTTKFCPQMVTLWSHMKKCREKNCKTPHCLSSRRVLKHFRVCKAENMTATCEICGPVMKCIQSRSAQAGGEDEIDPMEELANVQAAVFNEMNDPADGVGQDILGQNSAGDMDDPLMTMPLASLGGGAQGRDTNSVKSNMVEHFMARKQQLLQTLQHQSAASNEIQPLNDTQARQEAKQKFQQAHLLLQQLQQQQAQLLEQQRQIQQQQQHVLPQSPQGQQLQQKHALLQKLQEEFKQQQGLLQKELKQGSLILQKGQTNGEPTLSIAGAMAQIPMSTSSGARSHSSGAGNNEAFNNKRNWAAASVSGVIKGKGNKGGSAGKGKRLGKLAKEKSKPKPSLTMSSKSLVGLDNQSADNITSSANAAEDLSQPPRKRTKIDCVPSDSSASNSVQNAAALDREAGPHNVSCTAEGSILTPQFISQKCLPIVRNLINDPSGWVFKDPVDPVELGLPDYFDIVKHPMNLVLIEERLENGFYHDLGNIEKDVKLVFQNAILYNGENSDVGEIAKGMLSIFEKGYQALVSGVMPQSSVAGGVKLKDDEEAVLGNDDDVTEDLLKLENSPLSCSEKPDDDEVDIFDDESDK